MQMSFECCSFFLFSAEAQLDSRFVCADRFVSSLLETPSKTVSSKQSAAADGSLNF